jgi:hypothetical protein
LLSVDTVADSQSLVSAAQLRSGVGQGEFARNPGCTLERVQQEMENGKDNVSVSLARRGPVFIIYGTAIAYENNEVHFYDDIYGHDTKLAKALARGYPYP